jgi:hypothetical protein
MPKNYSKAELNKLVQEFTAEFDAMVKAEVERNGKPLNKSEEGGDKSSSDKEKSSGGESDGGSESSGGGSDAPPAGPPGGDDASAGGPPADPASAPAGGPPADPASAGGVPPADPAAGASGGDPVQALVQAYSQLSRDELQVHFFAMKQVLNSQMGADPAAGGDPAAAGGMPPAPAGPGAGAPPGPAGGMPPPGPDAAAPMAGEGSKPVDPAASMAMKSEYEKQLNLIKKERDAALSREQQLQKSLTGLTDQLERFVGKPERKALQGKDLLKSEPQTTTTTMTKDQIVKKLAVVARNPELKKHDRDLITKFCVGGVKVDAIAHLLG